VGEETTSRTARREVDKTRAATRLANSRLARDTPDPDTRVSGKSTFSKSKSAGAMNADEEMENNDPTENAAMAEDFGKTIKNALNGGKGPLLKLMKVRARFTRDTLPYSIQSNPSPKQQQQRPTDKFEPRSPPHSQGISETLSKVGQGEDGGELKTLPKQLVLKGLLSHKDKVRTTRPTTDARGTTLFESHSTRCLLFRLRDRELTLANF
jgi:hypothetical protein